MICAGIHFLIGGAGGFALVETCVSLFSSSWVGTVRLIPEHVCFQVLDSMVYSLGITKHDVRHTVSTLRDYGNISSGAFLLAFERLQQEGTVKCGDIGMFVTMGPGAGMECSLFRVRADIVPHKP